MSGAARANPHTILPRCPLCNAGSAGAQVIAQSEDVFVRCRCGLVYKRDSSREPPSEPTLGHGYDAAYFETYRRRGRRRIAKSRTQIRDALELTGGRRLLDVGCSLGYTLEAARSLGLEASGVDVSEHALAHCRSLGFQARFGHLESLPYEDASFDVAVLKHVLEHTSRPRGALAELRRVLAPQGAAFIAVPDVGYFKAAWQPGTSRFFRGEGGRAHFIYYSPATLSRLLEEEGFRVESVHPRLIHRRAARSSRAVECALAPLRAPLQRLRTVLRLRKEFWLVARRV